MSEPGEKPGYELTPAEIREKITVCIVDDFATVGHVLKNMLGKIGFNPKNVNAIYGSKAAFEMKKTIELCKSYEPELSWKIPKLFFVDWNMPGLSGIELLKMVRNDKDPRISNLIFVMVTSEAVKEKVIAAVQAGVDNYITKPNTVETVEKKLNEVSTKLLRKAETLARKSPEDISSVIEMLNLAIALDLKSEKAQALKQEILGSNQKQVVKIVGVKVTTGKNSAEKGKYSKAVGEFGNALDLKPSDPRALMEYGKMMMKKTMYEEAVDSFESALKFLKDDLEAQQLIREVDLLDLLGEAQLKFSLILEDPDEMAESSIKTLKQATKLYEEEKDETGHAKSLTKIGNVYSARAADAERKAAAAKDAVEAGKHKEKAQGHNEQAISEYEEAIKQDVKQSATLIRLADAYKKTGKEDEAGKAMKKAQELEPDDVEALIEFGKAFLDKGDMKTAVTYFNSAKRKISREDIELYEEMILELLEHDLPEEAIPFIDTVIKERPDLYNNLGLAYRRENKLKEAINAYSKAIEFDLTGDRVGYLFNQGLAYWADGNAVLAIKNFIQAYKTDRTFERAVVHLERNSASLCNRALQDLKNNDKSLATAKFKLAYVADNHSNTAKDELIKLGVDPTTILTDASLRQLGVDDPSVILEASEC